MIIYLLDNEVRQNVANIFEVFIGFITNAEPYEGAAFSGFSFAGVHGILKTGGRKNARRRAADDGETIFSFQIHRYKGVL
jgi:hypothetical protein